MKFIIQVRIPKIKREVTSKDKIVIILSLAAMAELVDALDSGSSRGNSVDVRVILAAIDFKAEHL